MYRNHIILFIYYLMTFSMVAQEATPVTMEKVLRQVKENNLNILISQEAYEEARGLYQQTHSVFLPQVSAAHTAIITTNPLMAFGSKLNQEILTPADFDPSRLNNPEETRNFATLIEVQQPLINLDGIYQRKAARLGMEAAQMNTGRTRDHILLETQKAYMQLQLAYKTVGVLEKARNAALENKRLAENSFKQGYLQRAELLSVDVRVNEVTNQLTQAKSQVKNASDHLSFLMGESPETIFIPSDSLIAITPQNLNTTLPSTRADIQAMDMATQAQKMASKAEKLSVLPRLNAFGSYQLYDDEIFQGNANGYLVGASLSWDLFKGYSQQGKIQEKEAAYKRSELALEEYKNRSQMELNQALRTLEVTARRLELSALALEQSAESLRIRRNRFREGLEKSSDLLLAESQYAQKELEYYQTVFEYNFSQAYLQFLTKA